MKVILEGKTVTPVVTKYPVFFLKGYQAAFKKGTIRRRHYNKINATIAMYPYSLICYEGILQLTFYCRTKAQATKQIDKFMAINQIGRLQSEGLGKIQWLGGSIQKRNKDTRGFYNQTRKLKIRKGLPHDLPTKVQELLRYGMLHDFFNTSRHPSKIYVEPSLDDPTYIDLLRDHHDNTYNSDLITTFQRYDRIAASITRKHRSPRNNRYNWKATKKVDFPALAKQLAEVSNNPWKLYNFIYTCNDLAWLNESFEFGHTSLRMHLLILVNLIVFDYLQGTLFPGEII